MIDSHPWHEALRNCYLFGFWRHYVQIRWMDSDGFYKGKAYSINRLNMWFNQRKNCNSRACSFIMVSSKWSWCQNLILSVLTLPWQCLRTVGTSFGGIFNAHLIGTEFPIFSQNGHFLKSEASGSHNFGVLRPRKMILTILEPAFDDVSNDLSHCGKNFAQWATGGKMGFWRLVKFPKSASPKSF